MTLRPRRSSSKMVDLFVSWSYETLLRLKEIRLRREILGVRPDYIEHPSADAPAN